MYIRSILQCIYNYITCSRLAITTKVTLDQVLGGVLWQVALLSIHEPYRAAALNVWKKIEKDVKERFPKRKVLAVTAR